MEVQIKEGLGGSGRSCFLSVTTSTSVQELKNSIFKKFSILPQDQRLYFKSQFLLDDQRLSYYRINPKDVIICNINPDATPPKPTGSSSNIAGLDRSSKSSLGGEAGGLRASQKSQSSKTPMKHAQSNFSTSIGSASKPSTGTGQKHDNEQDISGFETEDSDDELFMQSSRDRSTDILQNVLSKEETSLRMSQCRTRAEAGRFNADTHIVDPTAYYSHLYHLQEQVVLVSEYFKCNGYYWVENDTVKEDWARDLTLQEQIPRVMMSMLPRNHLAPAIAPSRQLPGLEGMLESLCKSYIILCGVLASFDYLRKLGFCHTFYSILAKRQEAGLNMAELVQIDRQQLDNLKSDFEVTISHLFSESLSPDSLILLFKRALESSCNRFLNLIGLSIRFPPSKAGSRLAIMCRVTVLLLDLGLVTYVGSHGSLFTSYVRSDEEIEIRSNNMQVCCFKCSLMPLACLKDILSTPVWVFQSDNQVLPAQGSASPNKELLIQTRMDVFADVWGPVWPVHETPQDPSSPILQYNVSRGFIRRSEHSKGEVKNAVMCHLYPRSFSDKDQSSNQTAGETKPLPLAKNDLLAIGASLREDPECLYRAEHYEDDYQDHMGYLGTIPDTWRLESRALGFSAGQFVGIVANGTQKMLPGVTLKEQIWNQFSQSPQNANIDWLNNFIGVEISHCTGNARRIRLKDLLRVKKVRERLGRLSPDWDTTAWGEQFSRALNDPDFAVMQKLWDQETVREDIGKLIAGMLELLHTTGLQGRHLIAAYFRNRGVDKASAIPIRGNEWSKSLGDTLLTATYAVVGDVCLQYRNNSPEICSQQRTTTILQSQITFPNEVVQPGSCVRLKPIGRKFLIDDIRRHNVTLIPISRMPIPQTIVATEVLEELEFSTRAKFTAIMKAAAESYGGMTERRQLVRDRQRPRRNEPLSSARHRSQRSPRPQEIEQDGLVEVEPRSRQRNNARRTRKGTAQQSSTCCFQ